MLFNKRHSACLCSASNLLNLLPGSGREPACSHLCCEAMRQAKNKLSAGPKLFKDIVCTCNLTAGKRKLWFHWSWLEWWFFFFAQPIRASSSLRYKSCIQIFRVKLVLQKAGKDVSSGACSSFYSEGTIKLGEGVLIVVESWWLGGKSSCF